MPPRHLRGGGLSSPSPPQGWCWAWLLPPRPQGWGWGGAPPAHLGKQDGAGARLAEVAGGCAARRSQELTLLAGGSCS